MPPHLGIVTRTMPHETSVAAAAVGWSAVERSLLLAAVYGDLFDHPLTGDELRRYRVGGDGSAEVGETELKSVLDRLCQRGVLEERDGMCFFPGREGLVAVRRQRERASQGRWRAAGRFARWLRHVPFVRMVAVCGSQAMENGDEEADIDLFVIVAPRRLWIAQAATMLLRRLFGLSGARICPNYFLSLDELTITQRSLYTAREVAQTVPLWGAPAYVEFLAANRWIGGFLPGLELDDRRRFLHPGGSSVVARWMERSLGGRFGHVVSRSLRRLLLAWYRRRWRPLGVGAEALDAAYAEGRQEVVQGGYGASVAAAFARRAGEVLGEPLPPDELDRLFPEHGCEAAEPFARQMAERYGVGVG